MTSTGTSPAPTASPIGFHSFSGCCCSADIVIVGKEEDVVVWQGRIDELMKKFELDSVGLVVVCGELDSLRCASRCDLASLPE